MNVLLVVTDKDLEEALEVENMSFSEILVEILTEISKGYSANTKFVYIEDIEERKLLEAVECIRKELEADTSGRLFIGSGVEICWSHLNVFGLEKTRLIKRRYKFSRYYFRSYAPKLIDGKFYSLLKNVPIDLRFKVLAFYVEDSVLIIGIEDKRTGRGKIFKAVAIEFDEFLEKVRTFEDFIDLLKQRFEEKRAAMFR